MAMAYSVKRWQRHVLACRSWCNYSVYLIINSPQYKRLNFQTNLNYEASKRDRLSLITSFCDMKSVFKILPLTLTLVLATGIVNSASLLKLVSQENEQSWAEWKSLHKKSYTAAYEENFRRAIWRYNLKVRLTITFHTNKI